MKLKLVKIQNEAKSVKSFIWKPENPISWIPGQYFYFTLPKLKYEDARGSTRQFTISSSPTENGMLRMTTKFPMPMSGYKKTLLELKKGDTINGEGPSGMLNYDESEANKSHFFLAGGIGITPFRAFIKYNIDRKFITNLHLIYSCSSVNEVAFKKELEKWATKYDSFKLYITITKPGEINWKGLKGRIGFDLLKKLFKGHKPENSAFWVVGPSNFVYSMEEIIDNFDILPENKHIEIFSGY